MYSKQTMDSVLMQQIKHTKPIVNYSVHDLLSKTPNAIQVRRHLLKHLWKHKNTIFLDQVASKSKSLGECRQLDKCLETAANKVCLQVSIQATPPAMEAMQYFK